MASHYRDAAKCLKAVDGGRTTLKTADRLHVRLCEPEACVRANAGSSGVEAAAHSAAVSLRGPRSGSARSSRYTTRPAPSER